jgi:hypothetical protein
MNTLAVTHEFTDVSFDSGHTFAVIVLTDDNSLNKAKLTAACEEYFNDEVVGFAPETDDISRIDTVLLLDVNDDVRFTESIKISTTAIY